MTLLVLRAYGLLISFHFYLIRGDFAGLYHKVRHCPVAEAVPFCYSIADICLAVDLACICYPKQVFCLQRSAATAFLLKHLGTAARLVIGAQQIPFKSHAWVEVDGTVVNDKPYTTEIYAVLDRC
jgi:hypothetical protein